MIAWNAGRLAEWESFNDEIPAATWELYYELWRRGRVGEKRADLRARQFLRCLYAMNAKEFDDTAFDGYLREAEEQTEEGEVGPTIEESRDHVRAMLDGF